MTQLIEATYRVVTPLFSAGADRSSPELRAPSFKGVLRFWWRALAWSRFGGDLTRIREKEDEIFGSDRTGQSKVILTVRTQGTVTTLPVGQVLTNANGATVGHGARYFGYGALEAFGDRCGQLIRACIKSPLDFTVRASCSRLDSNDAFSVLEAFKAVGLFGSLGARGRRGYGSLALQTLTFNGGSVWNAPGGSRDLAQGVRHTLSSDAIDVPPYTALSNQSRHLLVTTASGDPLALLDTIGREMVRYRSWGHKGMVLGSVASERLFKDDHDLMESTQRADHPRRVAFGLPHNYGKPNTKQVKPVSEVSDRRASPLLIHIHVCNDTPVGIVSFMPASFLPPGQAVISVGGTRVPQRPESELYQPVHDFLNRLLSPQQRKEPFTLVEEVVR